VLLPSTAQAQALPVGIPAGSTSTICPAAHGFAPNVDCYCSPANEVWAHNPTAIGGGSWTGQIFQFSGPSAGQPYSCGAGGAQPSFSEMTERQAADYAMSNLKARLDLGLESNGRQRTVQLVAKERLGFGVRTSTATSDVNRDLNLVLQRVLDVGLGSGPPDDISFPDVWLVSKGKLELNYEGGDEYSNREMSRRFSEVLGLKILSGEISLEEAYEVFSSATVDDAIAAAKAYIEPNVEQFLSGASSKNPRNSSLALSKSSQGTPTAFPTNFTLFRGFTEGGAEFLGSLNVSGYSDTRTATTTTGRSIGVSGFIRKELNDTTTGGMGFNLSFGNSGNGTDWRNTVTVGLSGFVVHKIENGSSVDASLGLSRIMANTFRTGGTITGNYGQTVLGLNVGFTPKSWTIGDNTVSVRIDHSHNASTREAYTESDATVNAASTTITGTSSIMLSINRPHSSRRLTEGTLALNIGARSETYGGTGAVYVPLGVSLSGKMNGKPVTASLNLTLANGYSAGSLGASFEIRF